MGPTVRPTIRTRLTLAAAAVTIVMLAVASFTLVAVQRRALTNGIDESLRQTVDNLTDLDNTNPVLGPVGDPEDTFVQVIDEQGNVVAATSNLPDSPVIDTTDTGIRTARIDQPRGRFRILTHTIDDDRLVLAGKNLDDVTESVHVLIVALAVVSPALILLLVGLAWWLVGRTLTPVDAIRREVNDIGGADLHRRVPVPDTDDEIATLARTMNDMLGRVQAASERQQQFVDDASHELRTPLTRMITDLDVALAHPGTDGAGQEATLRRLHEDASDLQRLLADLLYLARSSHDRPVPHTEVDLDDIALAAAADLRPVADVRVDTSGVSAASARGDERALRRAVANIVTNGIHHARTTVRLSVEPHPGSSTVTVDDDGTGIPPDERERVFERFTRLDEARARDRGGAGLGLAIADEIIRRHGGTITIADSPDGGARFTISLPSGATD